MTEWEKPGPGAWEFDGAHSSGPTSRMVQELFPAAMEAGFRQSTARYGLLLSHIEVRYVHGFAYGAARIAGVPPSDRPAPPAAVLRVLSRLHPEMRRRDRTARAALAERRWVADLHRWFDEQRPAQIASLRARQAIDPATLDDAALADHVQTCAAALADGLQLHFSLIGASSVPVGLYLVRERNRGRTSAEAFLDLTGAAARSTAATLPALRTIADALGDSVPATLDDVRAASPAAATALDAYLEEHGQRIVGANDVTGRRLVEMPDVILRSIAAARNHDWTPPTPDGSDELLTDARLAVASRDDHAGICGAWPVGLLRRAALVAGERLHAAGRLDDPMAVADCTAAELAALLLGSGPSRDEVSARTAERQHFQAVIPPPALGTPHPPPHPAAFPTGLRTMAEAMGAFLQVLNTDRTGRGAGIGTTSHRGRAVVATDADDAIERLQPGDVLVTPMTTPAFNCILPIAGALVTVHGGPMSHAGIVARELGIPAVVGVADALDRINDGDVVEVDPVAGAVRRVAD